MTLVPGLQELVEKVPELATPRGFLRAVATALGVMIVALVVLIVADRMATWLGLLVQVALYGVLYWFVKGFFQGREARLTYTDAFFGRFLPAAGINLASLLFILFSGGGSTGSDAGGQLFPTIIGVIVALYLLVTAVMILFRSLQVAGIDTIAGVYVYYPDEGQQIEAGLYRVMRHPIYGAIDRVALALAFGAGTAYALLLAVIYVAVWHPIWIGVEERELVGRLGDSYTDYQGRVAAVWPQGLTGEATLWQELTGRTAAEPVALPEASAGTEDMAPPAE